MTTCLKAPCPILSASFCGKGGIPLTPTYLFIFAVVTTTKVLNHVVTPPIVQTEAATGNPLLRPLNRYFFLDGLPWLFDRLHRPHPKNPASLLSPRAPYQRHQALDENAIAGFQCFVQTTRIQLQASLYHVDQPARFAAIGVGEHIGA